MTVPPAKVKWLSARQQARRPEFVQKWKAIGLSTEPADRIRAERAIAGLYRLAKLEQPLVIWLPCPLSGALAAIVYAMLCGSRVIKRSSSGVATAINAAVRAQLRNATESMVHASLLSLLESELSEAVNSAVYTEVGSRVRRSAIGRWNDETWWELIEDLPTKVHEAAGLGAGHSVRIAIEEVVGAAFNHAGGAHFDRTAVSTIESAINCAMTSVMSLAEKPPDGIVIPHYAPGSYIAGSLRPGLCAYADFVDEVLGVPCDPGERELAASCGFVWLLDELCFVCERPRTIHLDEQGKLHCETGQAVSYPSGWGIWARHGCAST